MRTPPLVLALFVASCGGAPPSVPPQHGQRSELSAAGADAELCEHRVPAEVCTQCNPTLAAQFEAVGDWCGEHGVPESQCHACHPNLDFSPLPEVPPDADLAELAPDVALAGLAEHAAAGKVTVFDFYAAWCVPCREVDVHLRERLQTAEKLAVRRIDIGTWDGPLAKKYLARATSLPFVVVFDAQGGRAGELAGLDLEALDALLESAGLAR